MTNLVQGQFVNASEIGELKGLLASARAQGLRVAIIRIPRRLFAIDVRYQTPLRTNRSLDYLTNNFDENKLLPVTGVPHDEEGKIYLVDGYGRWQASQIVDQRCGTTNYQSLECLVILNAPTDPEERLKFEAEQYAFQNKNVSSLSPVQKHGAYQCMGHPAAKIIDDMQEKYKFTFAETAGMRSPGVLGSYDTVFRICDKFGEECADWIFDVCAKSGFHYKLNGYATHIMIALKDIWKYYPESRKETSEHLSAWLRDNDPAKFKAKAVARYGLLDKRAACSMYLEDLIVDNIDLQHTRHLGADGKSITVIVKTA